MPVDDNVSLTISNIELSGANNDPSVSNPGGPSNGAGILFETGNGTLTVLNSWIHGNEDGILTGAADAASTNGMYVYIGNSESATTVRRRPVRAMVTIIIYMSGH